MNSGLRVVEESEDGAFWTSMTWQRFAYEMFMNM